MRGTKLLNTFAAKQKGKNGNAPTHEFIRNKNSAFSQEVLEVFISNSNIELATVRQKIEYPSCVKNCPVKTVCSSLRLKFSLPSFLTVSSFLPYSSLAFLSHLFLIENQVFLNKSFYLRPESKRVSAPRL